MQHGENMEVEKRAAKTAAKQAEAKQKAKEKAKAMAMVGTAAARERAVTPRSANVAAETTITSRNAYSSRTRSYASIASSRGMPQACANVRRRQLIRTIAIVDVADKRGTFAEPAQPGTPSAPIAT